MVLVSLSDQVWDQFAGFYKYQRLPVPPRPNEGIWVSLATGELVAGACVYPCDGPYAMVEHLATRPGVPDGIVDLALRHLLWNLLSYGTTRGKAIIAFPRSEAFGALLEEHGFAPQDGVVHVFSPSSGMLGQYEKKSPPQSPGGAVDTGATSEETLPKSPPRIKNAAKPRKAEST